MPYPDYNANFSQKYKDWSAMMESKYPFLQSGSTSALDTNGDKPSIISSLFGGGEGKYNFNNIMQGVGTVSTIDSMLSPIADMLAGQNQNTVGNVMKVIPGLSTVGGLVNAAFGSHINKDFVDSTNRQIRTMSGPLSEATTNESLLNDYLNYNELSHVAKSEVGSDGWFSHKAKKKTRALNSAIDEANIRGENSMLNTAQNVDSNNDLMALSNYAAYGGPLSDENYYDWGGAVQMAQNAIKKHEGWRSKTYLDKGGTPTIGWGFTNSGFRNKYKEGITNHYKRGMTQAKAQQELNWYLRNAAKTLDKIYGGFNLTDSQKAALLDTYYQRPASVSTNSRFYKALKAGDKNAVKYLGVAGYNSRNAVRQAMYTSGKIPTVDANTDYVAPSDNTRVVNNAKLLHDLSEDNTTKELASPADFSIKRSNAFAEVSPIKSELPSISISPSGIDTYFASAMQTPHAQTEVTAPRLLSTEQIMRNYDNFFNSLGESDYLAEGGNLGGLQGLNNWMGQATTAFNTISNWGKEDPSLGRNYGSGKYGAAGQIGMMSYDLIKAIRDATKPKRDPIDKLGLYADGGPLDSLVADINRRSKADFVQRLLDSNRDYIQDWESDNIATHKLGWATDDKGAIVFPNVQRINGKLYDFTDPKNKREKWDALDSAIERGDTLRMTPAQAEEFTKTYKKYYPKGKTFKAFGGDLLTHGADFTNGLTFVNEGGSHEENPNGGVPMGVDNNGTPNLVEEGETIWKGDYVFSDRLKVPESIRQKYHLKEGATYADASKKLSEDSSERPNDPISKRTLDVALGELSDAQEAERQSRAEATANRPQQEENIPQGEGVSEPSNQQEPNNSPTEDEMIAALNGVQGMAFGGNLFAPGGNLISSEGWQGFPYELPANYQAPKESLTPWEKYATVAADTQDDDSQIEPQAETESKTAPKGKHKDTYMRYAPIVGNFAMALNSIMNDPDYSNAEAIIRAAELAGKPVSLPVDVIGDYRTRKPFDERYLTNLINQNNAAAIRASLDIAGNNRAMGLAAILSNNAQNQAKLAEAARQSYTANRADDAQVSEFNRGTNMFNAEANNRRNSAQAQLNSQRQSAKLSGLARGYALRQALDDRRAAAISQNLSAALQGLGDMGWENSQRNWLQSLADRGVLKGMFNSDGKSDFSGISNPGTSATSTSGSKKNGGKIKTKKRRF